MITYMLSVSDASEILRRLYKYTKILNTLQITETALVTLCTTTNASPFIIIGKNISQNTNILCLFRFMVIKIFLNIWKFERLHQVKCRKIQASNNHYLTVKQCIILQKFYKYTKNVNKIKIRKLLWPHYALQLMRFPLI